MKTHELKTWPVYYEAIQNGSKTFEYRKDDRPFVVGDQLVLKEWDAGAVAYTGRETTRTITYVMRDGSFGLPPGWCILALGPAYTGKRGTP